jgi:hypothetical protein
MPFDLSNYEPVEDRLAKFWADHPAGRIGTELVHIGSDGYIVKASVWIENIYFPSNVSATATGYAQEAVTDRGVNSTSALENCETSAIGRALANLGYAPKGKRPSREEMRKASEPGRSERAVPVSDTGAASEPLTLPGANTDAAPSSSAAPNAAGTSGGEGRLSGEGGDPNLPTSRRDALWNQLVQFAGTKRKALNAVNTTMKASWTEGHISDIPEDDLEHTLKAFMQREGVA